MVKPAECAGKNCDTCGLCNDEIVAFKCNEGGGYMNNRERKMLAFVIEKIFELNIGRRISDKDIQQLDNIYRELDENEFINKYF